jgi:hypothetical protein
VGDVGLGPEQRRDLVPRRARLLHGQDREERETLPLRRATVDPDAVTLQVEPT